MVIQGRYKIRELIGKGGMGQVYLAVDQRLGHSVALKRTTVGDDPSLTDAFENEARTLAQLRHPFLPKVSDHFVEGDEQFLVMEYIAGDDLSQRLKAGNKAFPLNWVLFWADELLETLSYLHTHNPPIIHRDIKPQNLKLTNDNHIVLLDFGLSKHSVGHTKLTTSGSVVGYTPHYAPMEQIRGTGTSALSDIYALSATLYHLLTNRVPPDALTRADALLADKPDPLKPLTELNGEISEVISDAVMKGMALNQDKRFPSAREMQKRLRKAYNELQKSMSAETVAFNVGDIDSDSISGEKTEVIAGGIPEVLAESPVPEVVPPQTDGDKTEVIDSAQMQEYAEISNSQAPDPEPVVSEQTEVMSGLPSQAAEDEATADLPSPLPGASSYRTSEDLGETSVDEFVTNEDFDSGELANEPPAQEDSPELDKTVAGVGLDATAYADSGVPAAPPDSDGLEVEPEEPENFGFTEEFSGVGTEEELEEEQEYDSEPRESVVTATPEESPPAERKSSTGKYVAILLGMGAILVLVLGSAGAVGWYFWGGGFGFGDPNPEVTPLTTPFGEESPEGSPDMASPEVTPDSSPEELPSPDVDESPDSTPATGATPRRTPGRTPARTPAKTPAKTPTPRATPRKTPRTLPTILQ